MSYSLKDNKGKPLDAKLVNNYLKKDCGFFIELGANNGLLQSNTALLEFKKHWTGILIEPCRSAYEECVKNRPNSICYHGACVSNTYTKPVVHGNFETPNLMSCVNGLRGKAMLNKPEDYSNTSLVAVKAYKLDDILLANNIEHIDFLSLDVEGYEFNVLKGLNIRRNRPVFILIEIYNYDYENITKWMKENNYDLLCNFSGYNKKENPIWDGTHNDYLFKDASTNDVSLFP